MRSVLVNLASRLAALVPAAVATLLSTRLLLEHYDVQVFNAFTLIFSLMILIPLNDLGAGAALTTAVAEDGATHPRTQQVALTAARTLAASGLALAAVATVISLLDGWGQVLGEGAYASAAYGIALALYGASFVPGLAQSVLLGANRNEVTILVQASLPPAMAAGVGLCVAIDAPPWGIVLVPGVAILVISLVNAAVAPRETGLHLLHLVPKILKRREFPGTKIGDVAGPALIVVLTTPITLQSQRLILSHFGTPDDVANFSVAVQVFMPMFALLPAASRPLWPIFARQRTTGVQTISLGKVLVLFFFGTLVASGTLLVLAEPISRFITDEQVDFGIAVPALVALGTLIQAIALPLAMAMMYPAGLRVIARLSLVATPVNLVGSIIATQHIGGTGPLWVGAAVSIFLQTIPALVFVIRNAPGSGPAAEATAAEEDRSVADAPPTSVAPPVFDVTESLEAQALVFREPEAVLRPVLPDPPAPATAGPPRAPDPTGRTWADRWRENERGRSW